MGKMRKKIIQRGLIGILVLGFLGYGFAQEKEKSVSKKIETKEIQGEVTWIGKDFISLVYYTQGNEEYEIVLPFDPKELKTVYKKSLSEISVGDTVSIEFEEETETAEDKAPKIKRKAKLVRFIRPGRKKPEVTQEELGPEVPQE